MRWTTRRRPANPVRKDEWHQWFAWYPTSMRAADGSVDWVLFETVIRRRRALGRDYWWEYKDGPQ